LFMETFISADTLFEWISELKESIKRQVSTVPEASQKSVDEEASSDGAGGVETLFASAVKRSRIEGLSQYVTKMDNGHLYTARTPEEETGHKLIRLDVYDVNDIKGIEKRQWWRHAKMRSQFLTLSSVDRKQRMVDRLLDIVADDLRKVPGITKEVNSMYF
ncbi:hypothetical protein ALC62_11492, partial [Cyphomyrmex costatus]